MQAPESSPPPQRAETPRETARSGGFATLLGITPDGRRLRLVDPVGRELTVAIDARLRAALGPDPGQSVSGRAVIDSSTTRPNQVEAQMDSVLRPRDIQARIRAGESPESVAAAAGTTVDRLMPYTGPVLAEREHVAERAQRSSLRRPTSDGVARTLGDAVTGHLHTYNVDPTTVAWDAWRREDGRWALTGRYCVLGRDGLAELTFDQPGNFVLLDNDDARWLVGDLPDLVGLEPSSHAPDAGQAGGGGRRLSAVPDEQLSLDDDLLGVARAVCDGPIEAFLDDRRGLDESELAEQAADAAALDHRGESVTDSVSELASDPVSDPVSAPDVEPPSPPRRPVKKTRGRASVPSWDEIMFGGPPE